MRIQSVTDRQGIGFAKTARAKRVSREAFQRADSDGTLSRVLDGIKAGLPITIGILTIPPPGARIHTIKVKALLDREWQDAINAGGPNTPSDYNVRKVGDLYLPTGTGEVEEEHVLLNYPAGGGSLEKALAWAAQFKLTPNDPRRVFAEGEQHPNLHRDLGMNPMYSVAPVACTFGSDQRACGVWWGDAGRKAGLNWTGSFGDARDWFSFRK